MARQEAIASGCSIQQWYRTPFSSSVFLKLVKSLSFGILSTTFRISSRLSVYSTVRLSFSFSPFAMAAIEAWHPWAGSMRKERNYLTVMVWQIAWNRLIIGELVSRIWNPENSPIKAPVGQPRSPLNTTYCTSFMLFIHGDSRIRIISEMSLLIQINMSNMHVDRKKGKQKSLHGVYK